MDGAARRCDGERPRRTWRAAVGAQQRAGAFPRRRTDGGLKRWITLLRLQILRFQAEALRIRSVRFAIGVHYKDHRATAATVLEWPDADRQFVADLERVAAYSLGSKRCGRGRLDVPASLSRIAPG